MCGTVCTGAAGPSAWDWGDTGWVGSDRDDSQMGRGLGCKRYSNANRYQVTPPMTVCLPTDGS